MLACSLFITGPNDPDKFITSDDNSGDGKNAKIEEALIPNSDYFIVVRAFDPNGGEFHLSVNALNWQSWTGHGELNLA